MILNEMQKRDLRRWYPLKPIDEQTRLLETKTRYKIVVAGRRSGKTERAKRYLYKQAMKIVGPYFIAAPTFSQVKQIYWDDMKRLCFTSFLEKPPSESNLIIYLANGSTIHLIGLDKPKRMEGAFWLGGIVDETAYIKETALMQSVLPSLDTDNPEYPGYKPWCWFLGKPFGLNHFYRLYNMAKSGNDPEWSAYHWLSSEVLNKETIDAARRRMSAYEFRQEYEASFETVNGRIYPDYNELNHTNEIILPHEQILYTCDFNYTPMSHAICVRRGDDIYILDEVVLKSAIAEQNMLEFVHKYKDHENKTLLLYGDSSGKVGEKHGHESNYSNMEKVLLDNGWKFQRRVANANPPIVDRQNAVRAKICTADGHRTLFVNPTTAPWSSEGLATVQVKEGSSFIEDDKNEYQHITTAIGYMIHLEFPIIDDSKSGISINFDYGEEGYYNDNSNGF
jgi:hypothetical protein